MVHIKPEGAIEWTNLNKQAFECGDAVVVIRSFEEDGVIMRKGVPD